MYTLHTRITLLIVAAASLVSAIPAKLPHLVFERKTVQLDTMTQGETKEILFKFKNAGTADLIIDRTRSSCGCAVISSTKKQVLPDSTSTITVKFNSLQFRGDKTKTLFVYSNDPDQPVDTLTINVFVRSEIDCIPRNILLADAVKGVSVTQTVAFFNPGTVPVTLTTLSSPEYFIKPSLTKPITLKPGDTAQVSVAVTPPDSTVSFSGTIRVFTSGSVTNHPFSIRVHGRYKQL
jgi:hypothetical protein